MPDSPFGRAVRAVCKHSFVRQEMRANDNCRVDKRVRARDGRDRFGQPARAPARREVDAEDGCLVAGVLIVEEVGKHNIELSRNAWHGDGFLVVRLEVMPLHRQRAVNGRCVAAGVVAVVADADADLGKVCNRGGGQVGDDAQNCAVHALPDGDVRRDGRGDWHGVGRAHCLNAGDDRRSAART